MWQSWENCVLGGLARSHYCEGLGPHHTPAVAATHSSSCHVFWSVCSAVWRVWHSWLPTRKVSLKHPLVFFCFSSIRISGVCLCGVCLRVFAAVVSCAEARTERQMPCASIVHLVALRHGFSLKLGPGWHPANPIQKAPKNVCMEREYIQYIYILINPTAILFFWKIALFCIP